MKLIDMKLPKKDKKGTLNSPVATDFQHEEYPYGLCIRLNNDQIDKLGIFDNMDVDMDVVINAKATIKSKEKSEMQGGKSDKSLSIQIKEFGIEPEKSLDDTDVNDFMRRRNKK
jgi:hypothetical protein